MEEPQRVRLALVGCGALAGRLVAHFKLASAHLAVVAVCDTRPGVAEKAAEALEGAARPYRDLDTLIEESDQLHLDGLALLTPIPLHFEQVQKALAAGLHTYVQKPMAQTARQSQQLIDRAVAQKKVLVASPGQRSLRAYREARELLERGSIGKVMTVQCHASAPGHEHDPTSPDPTWYYRPGGGPLRDMGIYMLDALTGLLGPIQAVAASASLNVPVRYWREQPIQAAIPDTWGLVLEFPDGVRGTLETAYTTLTRNPDWGELVVKGHQGFIRIKRAETDSARYLLEAGNAQGEEMRETYGTGLADAHDLLEEAHVFADVFHFVEQVQQVTRGSGGPSYAYAENAVQVIATIEAAERSHETQKLTRVTPGHGS